MRFFWKNLKNKSMQSLLLGSKMNNIILICRGRIEYKLKKKAKEREIKEFLLVYGGFLELRLQLISSLVASFVVVNTKISKQVFQELLHNHISLSRKKIYLICVFIFPYIFSSFEISQSKHYITGL